VSIHVQEEMLVEPNKINLSFVICLPSFDGE